MMRSWRTAISKTKFRANVTLGLGTAAGENNPLDHAHRDGMLER